MNKTNITIFLISVLSFAGCTTKNTDKNSEAPVVDADTKGAITLMMALRKIFQKIFPVSPTQFLKKNH